MIDLASETLLSTQQAAERFNVAPRTIYNWISRGLEAIKIGGKVYTSVEAVERFAKPLGPEARMEPSQRRPRRASGSRMHEAAVKRLRENHGI